MRHQEQNRQDTIRKELLEGLRSTITLRTSTGAVATLVGDEVFVRLRRHFDRPTSSTLQSLRMKTVGNYTIVGSKYGENGTPGVYFTLARI